MMTFHEQLKAARLAAGLTAKQLAERIGVEAPSTIYDLEADRRSPTLATCERLAKALGCELLVELWPRTDTVSAKKLKALLKAVRKEKR